MTIVLDDILTQVADRERFLHTIEASHRRALMDTDYTDDLNTIREQISQTFEDLCSLNDNLISYDGPIRSAMATLNKNKDKLKNMNIKELELLREQERWDDLENGITSSKALTDRIQTTNQKTIHISTNYRKGLDEYITLVGVENTTLSQEGNPSNSAEKTTLENFQMEYELLLTTLTISDTEVTKLETLLNEFKRDNNIIRKELRSKQNIMKSYKNNISSELKRLENERGELLSNIGYNTSNSYSTTRTLIDSFIHLSVNKMSIDTLIEDKVTEYAQIFEYIDIKLDTLEHMLENNKSRQSEWKERKQRWEHVVKLTSQLENELRAQIVSATEVGLKIKPDDISSQISIKISQMKELLFTEIPKDPLNTLINDEIESLGIAIAELGFSNKAERKDVPNVSNIANPSLKIISKSPPKTGFSETYVNFETIKTSGKKED
ncbi:hypothetical protein RNJ44_00538 [Nakaseomyces bracarensis]|uniref:Autophagy-related protein 23 n=1 Tax=Nakaseomyces bracarensis TaxID=273131 RepID=A0ABR4NSV0_9SACH